MRSLQPATQKAIQPRSSPRDGLLLAALVRQNILGHRDPPRFHSSLDVFGLLLVHDVLLSKFFHQGFELGIMLCLGRVVRLNRGVALRLRHRHNLRNGRLFVVGALVEVGGTTHVNLVVVKVLFEIVVRAPALVILEVLRIAPLQTATEEDKGAGEKERERVSV